MEQTYVKIGGTKVIKRKQIIIAMLFKPELSKYKPFVNFVFNFFFKHEGLKCSLKGTKGTIIKYLNEAVQ